MSRAQSSQRSALRWVVPVMVMALACAFASVVWAQNSGSRDSLAHQLVAMAAADLEAGRPSLALFRIAQAEGLDPSVRVPEDMRRALRAHRARERTLVEQAERALREGNDDAARQALAQLARTDSRSPAALELMLHANAALTRRGGQYHRHRWFTAEPAAPAHPQPHARKER